MNPQTKQLYLMNKAANRKKIVKPTPAFQDTFVCAMGEDSCPIKKKLSEQTIELQTKDLQINEKQEKIEDLIQKFDDALSKEDGGPAKLKKIVKEVKESVVVAGRDEKIAEREAEIETLKGDIVELKGVIETLQTEKEEYMITGYEADMKHGEKMKAYKDLIRKHDHLLVKTGQLEAKDKNLTIAIREKSAYDKELSEKINGMVEVAEVLSNKVAKLRVKTGKLEKVKPEKVNLKKDGPVKRIFRMFRKNGS